MGHYGYLSRMRFLEVEFARPLSRLRGWLRKKGFNAPRGNQVLGVLTNSCIAEMMSTVSGSDSNGITSVTSNGQFPRMVCFFSRACAALYTRPRLRCACAGGGGALGAGVLASTNAASLVYQDMPHQTMPWYMDGERETWRCFRLRGAAQMASMAPRGIVWWGGGCLLTLSEFLG